MSDDPDAVLAARALGSCVALLAYDPRERVAGMLHYLLPAAELSRADADQRPGLFADSGIDLLLRTFRERHCPPHRLVLKAAGGARAFQTDSFEVGERNILALHAALRRRQLSLAASALGGTDARTVHLHVGSGAVRVRCHASKHYSEL
ncbi:MAG TPA: chemotaxis protein CheD [Polyangiales bacterium]|nr:chemotaxis protein CheD [Polyangiales bacterium]